LIVLKEKMAGNRILDRISYHSVYDESIIEALRYAADNGFSGIQLAVESPHLSFESLPDQEVIKVSECSKSSGIFISIHALDEAVSLFTHSKYLRKGIFCYYSALFDFAERIGCKLITIHIGSMTSFRTDTVPERLVPELDIPLYVELLNNNLRKLLQLARGRFLLCIENYNLSLEICEVLESYLRSEDLFLCWDLAKNSSDIESFFIKNIKSIRQVHLHDVVELSGKSRSHRVIGSGNINFRKCFDLLRDTEVSDYCIEVRPREKAAESLNALKEILKDHGDE
jgi:sugar phosphate isomerase/epimerase